LNIEANYSANAGCWFKYLRSNPLFLENVWNQGLTFREDELVDHNFCQNRFFF